MAVEGIRFELLRRGRGWTVSLVGRDFGGFTGETQGTRLLNTIVGGFQVKECLEFQMKKVDLRQVFPIRLKRKRSSSLGNPRAVKNFRTEVAKKPSAPTSQV